MACLKCKKSKEECLKESLNIIAICENCNTCKKCIKLKKIYCNKCSDKCNRCNKILPKNNFPDDEIINGYCDKCRHLCAICTKYVADTNSIYKNNIRYCIGCFETKFNKSDSDIKYKLVIKKRKDGFTNDFVSYSEDMIKANCATCDKKYWRSIKSRSKICNKCNISQTTTNDPSNNKIKYKMVTKNNKTKWVEDEKIVICKKCTSGFWIKYNNNYNYCDKCNPSNAYTKMKYDKKIQMWVAYSKLVICKLCREKKWMAGDNRICKKCTNLCVKN